MPVAGCIVATEKLGTRMDDDILARPIAVADAHLVLDCFRPTAMAGAG